MNIQLHVIRNDDDKLIGREHVSHVPRVGDEIRMGGEGNEKYYKVIMVIWIYDEPGCPFERVNIGVEEATVS